MLLPLSAQQAGGWQTRVNPDIQGISIAHPQ